MNIKKYHIFQYLSLLQIINQTHNINIIKDNNDRHNLLSLLNIILKK